MPSETREEKKKINEGKSVSVEVCEIHSLQEIYWNHEIIFALFVLFREACLTLFRGDQWGEKFKTPISGALRINFLADRCRKEQWPDNNRRWLAASKTAL